MKYEIDPHCHSIASGHAFSSIAEIMEAAAARGLKMVGIADHGPALPGGPHEFYFGNMKVLPDRMYGVELLKGVEANIIDFNGTLDLSDERLKALDIVLAGFHMPCIEPGTTEENTRGMIAAIEHDLVDIIVHPGNPVFPINMEPVLEAAKAHNTLIEINNSSFGISRKGSEDNCAKIAQRCMDMGVRVAVGSDSHYVSFVGEFGKVDRIFRQIGMPEDLIATGSVEGFKEFLKMKGKARFN